MTDDEARGQIGRRGDRHGRFQLKSSPAKQRGSAPLMLLAFVLVGFFGFTGVATILVIVQTVRCLSKDSTRNQGRKMVVWGFGGMAVAFVSLFFLFHAAINSAWPLVLVSGVLGFPTGAMIPVMNETWKRFKAL